MANRDVLVIGGGIAGAQTALLLAEKDRNVYMLDSATAIGGFFPLLDRQFPTNSCGVCFMSPKPPALCPIYESDFHENIEVITNSDITGLSGEAGNFEVTYTARPRFVDIEKCTLCDRCTEVCPVEVDSKFSEGLEKRKAIYMPFAQAIPRSYVIDEKTCTKCGECVKVCTPEAINLEEKPEDKKLKVGAIVMGFGFEPFAAKLKGEFGLGRYKNVLSSIQYERMLSFSGPSCGSPQRLSDGNGVKKIAFIQCVGSRDIACGREYCSSICCMYATKQAMVSKDRAKDLDAAVFYMDVRTMGKDYERYYEKAKNEYGVRYIRSAISSIRELKRTNNLLVAYGTESGELKEEEFDTVVLSVGFTPPEDIKRIATSLGVDLNEYSFCATNEFNPTSTSVPGIYVGGALREPKDIPETVVDACSAADDVSNLLDKLEEKDTGDSAEKRALPEIEELITGIFLCDTKGMLQQRLNMDTIIDSLKQDPNIACVEKVDITSLKKGMDTVKKIIIEKQLNRVIIAGYRSMSLSRKLRKGFSEAESENLYIDYSNIGEQCADVHRDDPAAATKKAMGLISASIRKVKRGYPVRVGKKKLQPGVLVVGGGIAGMTSSLSLAQQGMKVTLIEKENELGGLGRTAHFTLKGSDIQSLVKSLVSKVESHEDIEVFKEAGLKSLTGTWGNFTSRISIGEEEKEILHGAVIFATGGREASVEEYLYGENRNVVTQRQFEGLIAESDDRVKNAKNIMMIQCVGSRDEDRPYCSRVCCNHAVKNSLKLKEINPEVDIHVLNRDIRTYGFYEKKYLEARGKGVVFVRYEVTDKPKVSEKDGKVAVNFFDAIVNEQKTVDADLLVLSVGIEPNDNRELAEIADVELNADGFFAEANPKSAPLDSVDRGKYFCGLCHSPNHIEDALCQGKAAAARASALLWSGVESLSESQAFVNERRCSGCGICVTVCPYDARIIDESTNKAVVLEELCRGCGTCTIACPNGASQQFDFERVTMLEMLNEILES